MDLSTQLFQLAIVGVTLGSIYALVGLGLNIISNASNIVNFAQGEFVMLGGLTAVSLLTLARLPMPLAFALSVLIVVAIGMIFERLAIYPLKKASILELIIITIGGSFAIQGIAILIWQKDFYPMPAFSGENPIMLFNKVAVIPQAIWVLVITLAVVCALNLFFSNTIYGKAMRACADDADASQMVGINVRTMILNSFAISAALGAIGGIIITPITTMQYDRGPVLLLKGFASVVLGGVGNLFGAVMAGFLIGIFEAFAAGFLASGYKDAIALLALIIILVLKPTGLFGSQTME
jgi:branched-chain amino acid transport system permease protein